MSGEVLSSEWPAQNVLAVLGIGALVAGIAIAVGSWWRHRRRDAKAPTGT
jgi:hypothetical protein